MNADPTLLVFSDDWGRHPSSCQHLMRRLSAQYDVLWVNTIGTRKPRLDRQTISRAWEKLRHWSRPGDPASSPSGNVEVCNPRMWPWFTHHWDRRLNQQLLLRQLRPRIEACGQPVTAVTTLPIVADLVGHLPVERWIYYCVDDFSVWPGLDGETLARMERKLVELADEVIVVSENLQDRMAALGRPSQLLTHGVDLDHWRWDDQAPAPARLADSERPLVVFWGVVDRRMDLEYLGRLAADMQEGTILLVGPAADPDLALLRLPRVMHLPALPFEELPLLAREARVLVMPYADLPVTRAMQPLKLKEYLATGRPAVVRNLPSVADWDDCCDVADSAEAFSRLVRLRIETGVPAEQRAARERLADESWAAKAAQLTRVLEPRVSLAGMPATGCSQS